MKDVHSKKAKNIRLFKSLDSRTSTRLKTSHNQSTRKRKINSQTITQDFGSNTCNKDIEDLLGSKAYYPIEISKNIRIKLPVSNNYDNNKSSVFNYSRSNSSRRRLKRQQYPIASRNMTAWQYEK